MNFNGIINVYKEKGYTSFDVVALVRKTLGMKKVGHTGTLDPDATGVLPICLGKGTKVVDLLTDKDKTYRAEFVLGFRTDTQDISGTVVERSSKEVTSSEVEKALLSFLGDYQQVPPMYSALKHKGKKLYELARQGITIEREARPVKILDIKNMHQIDGTYYGFDVTCSKGTYIRTLIDDLGLKLGTFACMTELERIQVGPFHIEESITLEQLKKATAEDKAIDCIKPVDQLFQHYPRIQVSTDYEKPLYNGNKLPVDLVWDQDEACDRFRIYDSRDKFIAIYKKVLKDGITILKVEKMFH